MDKWTCAEIAERRERYNIIALRPVVQDCSPYTVFAQFIVFNLRVRTRDRYVMTKLPRGNCLEDTILSSASLYCCYPCLNKHTKHGSWLITYSRLQHKFAIIETISPKRPELSQKYLLHLSIFITNKHMACYRMYRFYL